MLRAREQAVERGRKRYVSVPCSKGHTERYTSNRSCCECQRERLQKNWRKYGK
jgi:hypothetical protein